MGCCGRIRGAVNLARAEMGILVVGLPQIVEARHDACRKCQDCDLGRCLYVPPGGKACGCYVWAKGRIRTEECPAGRWPDADSLRGVPADKT